jgi:tetratricopeptide (TPR) repeat protein
MAIQRDWEGACRLFDGALNKSRLFESALIGRGLLFIAAGRLQKASEHLFEASNLNPLNTPATALMCWNIYLSGEYERALDLIKHARGSGHYGVILDGVEALSLVQSSRSDAYLERIGPLAAKPSRGYIVQGILGYIYGISGQVESARLIIDSLKRRAMGRRCFHPYAIALPLIGLNEVEEAIEWLEESYRIGSIWSLGFSSDPILASLRSTSRYQSLMTRINYPAQKALSSND